MVRVEQLMTRDLACIDAAQAVSVAANLMRIRKIGSLLVKRGEELVGIVTESDIARKVVAFHLQPEFIHVEHIMSSPIVSIDESESIFEAAGIMKAAHTRHLAVGNESHILGMLSVRDLLAPVAKDELSPYEIDHDTSLSFLILLHTSTFILLLGPCHSSTLSHIPTPSRTYKRTLTVLYLSQNVTRR